MARESRPLGVLCLNRGVLSAQNGGVIACRFRLLDVGCKVTGIHICGVRLRQRRKR
jgi:hypothetical protein